MNAMKKTLLGSAAACLAAVASMAVAQQERATTKTDTDARVGDPYMLDVCVVSNEKLGSMGDPIVNVYEGREIRFCCKGCVKEFKKDPKAVLAKLDAVQTKKG